MMLPFREIFGASGIKAGQMMAQSHEQSTKIQPVLIFKNVQSMQSYVDIVVDAYVDVVVDIVDYFFQLTQFGRRKNRTFAIHQTNPITVDGWQLPTFPNSSIRFAHVPCPLMSTTVHRSRYLYIPGNVEEPSFLLSLESFGVCELNRSKRGFNPLEPFFPLPTS